MTPDDPQVRGSANEQPRVVRAVGIQRGGGGFGLACFIRHHDIEKRLATTTSTRCLADCAAEMDDHLSAHGILWDGSYRIGQARDIWTGGTPIPLALQILIDDDVITSTPAARDPWQTPHA
jgi:hypothetical protein